MHKLDTKSPYCRNQITGGRHRYTRDATWHEKDVIAAEGSFATALPDCCEKEGSQTGWEGVYLTYNWK